jgi:hypothetical protein
MAYFNHAIPKVFVGTQTTAANANVNLSNGFLITAGLPTQTLNQTSATVNSNYGVGTFGMFDASTFKSVANSGSGLGCCPLLLASASVFSNDVLSPTYGGVTETPKSRKIDPNKVTKFYRVDPCTPQQQVMHIGTTNYTKTLSPTDPKCCFTFLCGESYSLRIDIKGGPVLRALNHNAYQLVTFPAACCSGPVPSAIDSTLVFISWASQITTSPYMKDFLSPIVYDQSGLPWYAPGTVGAPRTWDNYVSPGFLAGKWAGMRILGAFVSTNFLDCTFQYTDHYEIEPIKFYAELVDFVGDPCEFTGLCVYTECPGLQSMGSGEEALRDLIMSEEYRQNGFNSDLRIREITQGNQELTAISRTTRYYQYVLIHHVVTHDNVRTPKEEQYRLEIITSVINTSFQTFVANWLAGCAGGCNAFEIESCSPCTPLAP